MTSPHPPTRVRVASVPASHPYVRHLGPPDGPDDVVRLPDPTEPWWPPAMLDPSWIVESASTYDLMHVHFGFDGVAPEQLEAVGRTLHELGKPLVVTVHDLRNPHHEAPALHEQQLEALLRNATCVVTLTEHAAEIIERRYGRRADVVAHPHIVDFDDMRRCQSRKRSDPLVVGLHLKSLRPNMETRVVDATVAGTRRVPGARLRLDVHLDVAEPNGARHDPELMARLHGLAEQGALELHAHDFFDERQFVDYLAALRVSVLPYRFGTHSGWLEACRDLGVTVVAPDCGSYHSQGTVHSYRCNERDGFDPVSCADAVEEALRAPATAPIDWRVRAAQRAAIAERHRDIYRRALDRMATSDRPARHPKTELA